MTSCVDRKTDTVIKLGCFLCAVSPLLRARGRCLAAAGGPTGGARWRTRRWGGTSTETCSGRRTFVLHVSRMSLWLWLMAHLFRYRRRILAAEGTQRERKTSSGSSGRWWVFPAPSLCLGSWRLWSVGSPGFVFLHWVWNNVCVQLWLQGGWQHGDWRGHAAATTKTDKLREEHAGLRSIHQGGSKVGEESRWGATERYDITC